MKRASYREAIAWIAMNDGDGQDDRLDFDSLKGYVTVCLIADIFCVSQARVADDVIKYRRGIE